MTAIWDGKISIENSCLHDSNGFAVQASESYILLKNCMISNIYRNEGFIFTTDIEPENVQIKIIGGSVKGKIGKFCNDNEMKGVCINNDVRILMEK